MSEETADRFRRTAAQWLHRKRRDETGVDCAECYKDAAGLLATMDAAMGGTGTENLAALVAELRTEK